MNRDKCPSDVLDVYDEAMSEGAATGLAPEIAELIFAFGMLLSFNVMLADDNRLGDFQELRQINSFADAVFKGLTGESALATIEAEEAKAAN